MAFFRNNSRIWMIGAIFLLPISFFLALPWLKQQPDMVTFIAGGIASIGTVAISLVIAVQKDADLDEWSRSGARFANQWGWLAGAAMIVAITAIPPLRSLIVALAGQVSEVANPDDRLVLISFMLGFSGLVLAQTLCTVVLGFWWRHWMTREG